MKKDSKENGLEHIIAVAGYSIQVIFRPHSVHISNDEMLEQLLASGAGALDALVHLIRQTFRTINDRDLEISSESLAVEIWGHVYCGRLADAIADKVPSALIEKIADKIISYCEVIDCGEGGYDSNRIFWDMLAPFKKAITS